MKSIKTKNYSKIIQFILFIIFTTNCFAQKKNNSIALKKGSSIVGVEMNFYKNDIDDNRSMNSSRNLERNSYEVGLNGQYLVTNKLAVGIGVAYNSSSYEDSTSPNLFRKETIGGFTPSISLQYFKDITNNFYYLPKLQYQYSNEKGENTNKNGNNQEVKTNSKNIETSIQLKPLQIGYCIKNKYLLQFSFVNIGYRNATNTENTEIPELNYKSSNFYLNLNPEIFDFSVSMIF